jgi:hypothetical protein
VEHRTSIPEEDFQECFEAWKKGLYKFVTEKGDYCEGKKLEFCSSSVAKLLRRWVHLLLAILRILKSVLYKEDTVI